MMGRILLVVMALMFGAVANAGTVYEAEVTRVIDGDSIEVVVDVLPRLNLTTVIRVAGYDSPEIRGKCVYEKEVAKQTRDVIDEFLFTSSYKVHLHSLKLGKFAGRYIAKVTLLDGKDLAQHMIANSYSVAYDGGKRKSWCDNE